MSPSATPFHLRPNKYIDRKLFIESLRLLSKVHGRDLRSYGYVSMGGVFLEDTRLMYTELALDKLMSIERKLTPYNRQRFNKPFPFIECRRLDVTQMIARYGDCIEELGTPKNIILWLDYENTQRDQQLAEIRELSTVLRAYDVVRVTMNANIDTLDRIKDPEDDVPEANVNDEEEPLSEEEALRRDRARKLNFQLGKFAPAFTPADMKKAQLAKVLSQAIYRALKEGIGVALQVQPVANFSYADQQRMVTVTATIWPIDRAERLLEEMRDYEFFAESPETVTEIAVPDLSIRERIELDRAFRSEDGNGGGAEAPAQAGHDGDQPEVPPDEDARQLLDPEQEILVENLFTPEELGQYRLFQRYYPVFARIAV